MAVCSRCGATVQSQFCGACGAPVGYPPVPAMPAYPAQPGVNLPKPRRWPWYLGIGLCVWLGGAYYFYQDDQKRFAEARNTGVDILSSDEKTGVVTARDRKTGKVITMNFKDLDADQVRVAAIGMPDWVPAYPNATESERPAQGVLRLAMEAPAAEVERFYETGLSQAGLTVTKTGRAGEEVTLTASEAAGGRGAVVEVKSEGAATRVTIRVRGK